MAPKAVTPLEKAAAAAYQQQWRAANPDRWKAIAGPARKKWNANNRDKYRECRRQHRYTVRREILDLLGGQKCARCGYDSDWRALQIDHIYGGGKRDKRTSAAGAGGPGIWALRKWLREHQTEARALYQVLCANCNWIKRFENGEHPGGRRVSKDAH